MRKPVNTTFFSVRLFFSTKTKQIIFDHTSVFVLFQLSTTLISVFIRNRILSNAYNFAYRPPKTPPDGNESIWRFFPAPISKASVFSARKTMRFQKGSTFETVFERRHFHQCFGSFQCGQRRGENASKSPHEVILLF